MALPERLQVVLDALKNKPQDRTELADGLDCGIHGVKNRISELRDNGYTIDYDRSDRKYHLDDSGGFDFDTEPEEPEPEPQEDELTNREEYILGELTTGATIDGLAEDLDERESVVTQHLIDLRRSGWEVYHDESTGMVSVEGDVELRSSEHKGTRTRKANKWWTLSHNALVREYKTVSQINSHIPESVKQEDWCLHMTDIHAGDKVRNDEGQVVYKTDMIPDVIDYITKQSLSLATHHGKEYDTAHLLWGGDFVTNEGIYEGQFEDIDAWLDEQHDTLVEPLVRQIKSHAKEFDTVQIVCQIGNHGNHRASGTSKHANADLVLYKTVRNIVAILQEEANILDNVSFALGEASAYRNFELRGGDLTGHLRHGQHRKPQAETSARKKEWLSTLRNHTFDVALMGHHHVQGMIPWDGPPVIATSSPKPAGGFVEQLGETVGTKHQDVASCFGVNDDGLTSYYPVDMRNYD